MNSGNRGASLFAALSRLLGTLLEMAKVRLALLGTEIELEKRRLLQGLVLGALALLLLGAGLVVLCAFVILLFWDGYRLPAAGLLTLALLGAGVLLARQARARLHHAGGLFAASTAELERDVAALSAQGPHD